MKIPLYKPYIGKREINAVLRVLKSKKLAKGRETEKFEKEFAKYVGRKYAIAVNSGTSGLHVLVRVMNWGQSDNVITTPFSYIASSNALLFEKVKPIFVDIDINTLNIDPKKIESKINKNTKGMLLVDILGLPLEQEELLKIKNKYKLQVIEDACEAICGLKNNNELADATVYGFHENKQLTSGGEGGMIVTDDFEIAEKCKAMRDQGRSLKKDWINNVTLGFNFRMTEMQAAFGREQLKNMDKILKKREVLARKYSTELKNNKNIITPYDKKRSWFLYFIRLNDSEARNKVFEALLSKGVISSKNYFPPIYNYPMYSDHEKNCTNTNTVSETLLALPMYYEMTNTDVKYIANIINKTLK